MENQEQNIGRPTGAEVMPLGNNMGGRPDMPAQMTPPPPMVVVQRAPEQQKPKSGLNVLGWSVPWWLVIVLVLALVYWVYQSKTSTTVVYSVNAPLLQPATTPGPGPATELMNRA